MAGLVVLFGVYMAYIFFLRKVVHSGVAAPVRLVTRCTASGSRIGVWTGSMTALRSASGMVRARQSNFIDGFYTGVARLNEFAWSVLGAPKTDGCGGTPPASPVNP